MGTYHTNDATRDNVASRIGTTAMIGVVRKA